MNKCSDCKKDSPILRSDYRKRGENGEWVVIIGAEERCCPKCAEKRGARTLKQISDEIMDEMKEVYRKLS